MDLKQQLIDRLTLARKIIRETPIIQLPDDHIDLFAKLEFMNGVGSIKDRPALWILIGAIERGDIGPGTTVVESSSGNFACALATFCRVLGLKFIPVIDANVSPFYEAYLRAYCDRVIKVEECDEYGNYLRKRLQVTKKLLADIPDCYWTNQYANPDGMDAHYQLTGLEICDGMRELDYIFLGVSSAGTIAGVSRRLKQHFPRIRVIAVDAEGSVIFGQRPGKRCIPGIGSSICPELVRHAMIDEVVIVSERDAVAACRELLERHHLFVGGSTGTTYSAIQNYFRNRPIKKRSKVLFLCCDKGTAYLHSIYDPHWVASHLPAPSTESSRLPAAV
jgi:N-(2-amino-2-carboxyethyl)-L-glutamate synthase